MKLSGEMVCQKRAVDHEAEIPDSRISKSRDKESAVRFMKEVLQCHGSPEKIITDGPRSCRAAMNEIGDSKKREVESWAGKRWRTAACRFNNGSVLANVHNHFDRNRHLVDRWTYKERR